MPALVVGPRVSPFWKAAGAIAAVVCLVLGARSVVRHAAHPVQSAAASPPPAVVAPLAEPSPEALVAPAETPSAESAGAAEETKRASLDALKQGKLDESIAAGE